MPDRPSSLDRVVEQLAKAIDAGEVVPEPDELEALAVVCDNAELPLLAARVRSWIPGAERVRAFMTTRVEDLLPRNWQ